MGEIFRFKNVVLRIWSDDHGPPHVEAFMPSMRKFEAKAKFRIDTLECIESRGFSEKALREIRKECEKDMKSSRRNGKKSTARIEFGPVELDVDEFDQKHAKERITIWIDEEVLDGFRERAQRENAKYQSLINQALREALKKPSLAERVERLEKKVGFAS